jgi:hypothetical protein
MGGIMNTKNPMDNYLQGPGVGAPVTPQQTRTLDDHSLVNQWQQAHQNGQFDPDLTHQVLGRFDKTIGMAVNKYKGPMTGPAINTHARNLAIEALQTYDPNKGAAFNTHLTNTLQRLQRRNAQAQTAYIPEGPAAYLGQAQQAHDEFADEFGRKPTPEEHEQRLNEMLPEKRRLPPGGLAPILALQRKTVSASNFESTPDTHAADLEAQNVGLLRQDLHPKDHPVYDAIYKGGLTSTGAIAKRLGMSDPAVSRAKSRIEQAAQTLPTPNAVKPQRGRKPLGQ